MRMLHQLLKLPWLPLFVVGLLVISSPSPGQIPKLPSNLQTGEPGEPGKAEETEEETAARLNQWLTEAKFAFESVNEAGAENRLPEGVDSADLADYRRSLEQIIVGIGRHQEVLAEIPAARKALEAAESENDGWTGFVEKPPYSVLMIDDFVEKQQKIGENAEIYRSSLEHFKGTLTSIQGEAQRAEISRKRILADAAEDVGENGAGSWKLAADRAKSRVLAVQARVLQSNISLLQDKAETAKIQLSLLKRQIGIAEKQSEFSDRDLAKVKADTADRQAKLRKEITTLRQRKPEAGAARVRARKALDQIIKATPEGSDVRQSPEFMLATIQLEAAESRIEVLEFVIAKLDSLDQLASYVPDLYQARKSMMETRSKDVRDAAILSLRTAMDRIKAWQIVTDSDLSALDADLSAVESRAALIPSGDPRLGAINELRSALWEKRAIIQRFIQALDARHRLVERWVDRFDESYRSRPLSERLSEISSWIWSLVVRFWTFEVFDYDETVVIGGQSTTSTHGVSLGKVIIALFFFCLAYFISARIKNRLQGAVVRRGRIAEAQANTLGNWIMIVVGVLLALLTLHFLRIPLTVFAFFGGALAIGLGFGTQTLIKNFISGIIVLFERKIRVGDVVDTGGTLGTVIEVNTRSSVLRGRDGRESLVPNSVFLENTITNLTLSNRFTRRFIDIGVAYGTSPQQVIGILGECAERHGLVQDDPEPLALLQDFGDNAIVFKLYFWVDLDGKTFGEQVESDLRLMIEKRFGEVGVQFPFPQRDVHLMTGSPIQVELSKSTQAEG